MTKPVNQGLFFLTRCTSSILTKRGTCSRKRYHKGTRTRRTRPCSRQTACRENKELVVPTMAITIKIELLAMGFKPAASDSCMYVKGEGDNICTIVAYVKHVLISGGSAHILQRAKKQLTGRFEMTGRGDASLVLGINVTRYYGGELLSIAQHNQCTLYVCTGAFRDIRSSLNIPGLGPKLPVYQPKKTGGRTDDNTIPKCIGVPGISGEMYDIRHWIVRNATVTGTK